MPASLVAVLVVGAPCIAGAQELPSDASVHQHEQAQDPHAGHDMASMSSMAREASGTSWLPDSTPMYALHVSTRGWQFMVHENAFVQFLHEPGDRGANQAGSINWVMGMAQRRVGAGRLSLRGMFSLEPWTIRGCGYPDLLATGERCDGEPIHDRQHPHDLFMELSVAYDAPIRGAIRWQVYAGPVGEPALGPVAYPHRVSALANPLAPISHHWLDATHITFGVVTAAVYNRRWKAEASAFNGREPDDRRTDFDIDALDSASARIWFLPTPNWAFQVSVGRLTDAEPSETGGSDLDVTRTTASATYHSALRDNRIWATTVAWGRNAESGHATSAWLMETNLTRNERDTWFGRFEVVGKTPHDLLVPETADVFTVAKLQGGYTRYLNARRGFTPGLGGTISAGLVPQTLQPFYGSRVNVGLGVYLTLRPRRQR